MIRKAIFAAGCFWCYQMAFDRLKGVLKTRVGYTGGNTNNPSYTVVCKGNTNHAEAIEITYDTKQISFSKLLEVFWAIHDPTSLNRQGNDIGTQYRSAIFYRNQRQKKLAENSISIYQQKLDKPIVTTLEKASTFYEAEDYHQNFFAKNPKHGYCQAIISPKWEKFSTKFQHILK